MMKTANNFLETPIMNEYIERVVDLLDPSLNQINNLSLDEARQRVLSDKPEAVREIDGSFALLAREGKNGPHGALDGPPDALFSGQARRRPGADCGRPHRRHFQPAQGRGPARAVSSQLHAHGAGALRRGNPAPRLPRPRPDLHALLPAATQLTFDRPPRNRPPLSR